MRRPDHIRRKLRRCLLSWYEKHRRVLPWRDSEDPYKIWVSEVMLQQTQVNTVEKYYQRFIGRFPTVRKLANADLSTVMKVWEGLGYYGRARNLHRAAREIVLRFGGRVPDDEKALLSLPGVGRYTAGAVLSIAYGKPVPVLDGNVIRVLTRIFHVTENVEKAETRRRLWSLAEDLLPQKRVGDFNQGLMEFGATVCTPKQPSCGVCPLGVFCEAKRLSIQTELPIRAPRRAIPHYDVTAGIIWRNGKFLITLRPPRGLLGGLWEFPGGKKEEGEGLKTCLRREIREELAIDINVGDPLVSVKHAYSHFRITLHVFRCMYAGGRIQLRECADYRWITAADLDGYAFPAADRKVIQILIERESGGWV